MYVPECSGNKDWTPITWRPTGSVTQAKPLALSVLAPSTYKLRYLPHAFSLECFQGKQGLELLQE